MATRQRRGQRAKSEMNVVPYIDVMLVLLVIFMISAPIINQSVEVNLPASSNAQDIEPPSANADLPRPLVVTIDSAGKYFVDRADENSLPVTTNLLRQITQDALRDNTATPVYLRADEQVGYGAVMVVMDVLKSSGAQAVNLVTEQPDNQ
ncbi:ExbD/TolR family protein [Ostreibacterium oceani]|uniref:Protein TolR n=1 Tax=Ostreibacterium oceani TaxID=2654998 RepID=A0A6N7F2P4_9GAMM|nr:ExbD/TolR family protein [Ostreibacterium oceani]MPV86136.1 protein TolR [Ostreibacterium oceani]